LRASRERDSDECFAFDGEFWRKARWIHSLVDPPVDL
jgi:hypothetical protein